MVKLIDYYANDEYQGTFESPPSKKRRAGISRADKGGDFNEALENILRDINSKSQRTKKSLVWALYETYEEDGKETDFKWYFCNF